MEYDCPAEVREATTAARASACSREASVAGVEAAVLDELGIAVVEDVDAEAMLDWWKILLFATVAFVGARV